MYMNGNFLPVLYSLHEALAQEKG
uniref:Uncharacterized protein n=1 Tax=Arundo donax TaxID=35708 RepID=A0A0A8XX68_ARUDO